MPLTVTCRCGKWFSAPDHLAGTTAACPSCGSPIAIGGQAAPATPAPQSRAQQPSAPAKQQAAAGSLLVTCGCGQSYKAPETLRGRSLPCPACGRAIPIPAAAAPQSAAGQFGLDPLAGNDPLADPLLSASLTGTPMAMSPAYDPLGRPMPSAPYGGPTLGQYGKPTGSADGPNWIIIGSIGGVALVLLILVGVIVATSLSGNSATPMAATNPPAATLSPAPEPVVPPAPPPAGAAPSSTPSVNATSPATALPPMPGSSNSAIGTVSPPQAPGAAPTGPATSGVNPVGVPAFGPGTAPGAPTTALSGAPPAGSPNSRLGAGPSGSSSAPPAGSSAGQGSANQSTRMVKIMSRKNPKDALDMPETVPPNPRGFATALPVWHGDSKAKLVGVYRVGDDSRTTNQGHYSWLHNILPFMGHQDIYDKFDMTKPLHDDRNLIPSCQLVPEFLVPGNPKQRWEGYPFEHLALTHFVGMSGIEDARNIVAGKLDRSDPRAGIFGYDRVAAINEITDGTSNTIAVIGVGDLANPWAMGGGATIRGARQPYFDTLTGFGSHGQKGAITMMADGSVRMISKDIDPAVFRAMCTIHGAESVDLPSAAPPFKLD